MSGPRTDEFATLLGIGVERRGGGRTVAVLTTDGRHANPHGTVHGAVFYAVAGAAVAAAANDAEHSGIISSVLVEYLQPAAIGDELYAEVTREVSTDREDIFAGTVRRGVAGDLLAWVRARGTRAGPPGLDPSAATTAASSPDGRICGNRVIDATSPGLRVGSMRERHVVIVAFDGSQPLDAVGPHEVFAGAGRAAASLGPRRRLPGHPRLGCRRHGARRERARARDRSAPGARRAHRHAGAGRRQRRRRRRRRRIPGELDPSRCPTLPPGRDGVLGRLPRCGGGPARRTTRHDPLGPRRPASCGLSRAHGRPRPDLHPRRKYWSSAGVTAGIDLSLALVQEDLGVDVAQTVARWLVMFLHRPGGQTQFASPVWVPRAERSTVRAVQTVVEAGPGGDHRLPALAAAAAMSVRHFTRVFTAEVGETPSRFVERTRLEAARRELEETGDTLDVVAARCGLGSTETLRRVFRRHLGVSPDAYRRRFRRSPSERAPA